MGRSADPAGQNRGRADPHRIDVVVGRARVSLAPAALAMLTAACGSWQEAGSATSETEAERGDDWLTVMSWNTAHGRKTSMDAVAFVIDLVQPDVVLLQETHPEQAARIARGLGMVAPGGTVSKAALFATPEISSYSTDSLTGGRWPRSLDVYTYRGIAIANAHLDVWEEDRRVQARQVIQILEDENLAVLGGDVNDTPDSEVLGLFREAGWIDLGHQAPTFPTGDPHRRLDYILGTRSWRRVSYILDNPMSDHLPVIVEIDLSSPDPARR